MKVRSTYTVDELKTGLDTWESLNRMLLDTTLTEAKKLLALEKAGRKRRNFVFRIHSRINKLRANEERVALLQELTK